MSIILLGAPGSGKGTQGKLIEERLNYNNIIAGDLLRKEKQPGYKGISQLGKEISEIIDKGNLVPDEMISGMIKNRIAQLYYTFGATKGFLFDGYPRTIGQAKDLELMYKKYIIMEPVHKVIYIDVPEEVLVQRLLERGKISGREDDANEEIIRRRMKNYHEITEPLVDFYKNKLVKINGDRDIEEIFNDIKGYIPKPKYDSSLKVEVVSLSDKG